MDLFTPVVPVEAQHPNFRSITIPGRCAGEMEVLQNWAEGFADRDGKFVKEFQTSFNPCFWELYLHAAFRALGFTATYAFASPDFILSGPSDIAAEATIAAQPSGFVPEWEREISVQALRDADPAAIVELASIRLSNAIFTKQKKYMDDYAKLAHVRGKPFVICVAPFEQPFFYFQSDQAIRRVLFGIDEPLVVDNKATGQRIVVGESLVDRVRKESGTELQLGLFTRPGLEHVSAVVFSPVATFGKVRALAKPGPYPVAFQAIRYAGDSQHHHVVEGFRPHYAESLLDGLHVLLNPFADRVLDTKVFRRSDIAIHHYDISRQQYAVDAHEGFLFFRQTRSLVPTDKPSKPAEVGKRGGSAFRKFIPAPLPEGELVPTGGHLWPSAENYFAHYRGWTVVIYRDTIDNDWGGQAVQALCKELAAFRRYNGDESIQSIMVDNWFPTKEKALARAKQQIDNVLDASAPRKGRPRPARRKRPKR